MALEPLTKFLGRRAAALKGGSSFPKLIIFLYRDSMDEQFAKSCLTFSCLSKQDFHCRSPRNKSYTRVYRNELKIWFWISPKTWGWTIATSSYFSQYERSDLTTKPLVTV